ncbi:MAG: OmpA family protein [Saprospiraceae bacterium]|nr:OmpA family protein [Saprospiraceae bacterium]
MANLLDSFRQYLSPGLIHQAAALFGENENSLARAAGSLAPTMLVGMLNKTDDAHNLGTIFKALQNFDPKVLDNLPDLLGSGNLAHHDPKDDAGHLLGMLFGDKVPALTNAVAAFSGARSSTVSSLWGLVGPVVMGMLSKRIGEENLPAAGLANLLKQDKNALLAALPAGVAALLPSASEPAPPAEQEAQAGGMSWLWPLLLLLGLGGGIIFYLKNCRQETVETEAPAVPEVKTDTVPALPAPFRAKLANGFELEGNTDGIEQALLNFIQSDLPVDKTTWFNFDRLTFRTGSAEIDMDKSSSQLNNIYQIMQAFPKVKLKIGGYTDNVGKEADNMKLSQARAEATVKALETLGVAKGRLSPEGYGSQHPAASNDTEEGRAQNRRIAVRVMEK